MKKLSLVVTFSFLCSVFTLNAVDQKSKELYQAIKSNNPKKVEEIIAANPGIQKKKIKFYDYPVIEAANLRALKALKVLVDKGANINQKDELGNTILHYFAKARMKKEQLDEALAYCVTEKKMKIETKNKEGKTPFLWVFSYDRHVPAASTLIPVIEVFAKYKADLNAQDKKGKTALHYVLGNTYLGKEPNKVDINKKFAAAKILADMKGVNVNVADKEKRTPLIAFLANVKDVDDDKKVDMITCLMENGAKTTGRSKKKESPLKMVDRKSEAYKAMKKRYKKKKK